MLPDGMGGLGAALAWGGGGGGEALMGVATGALNPRLDPTDIAI